MGLRLEQKKDIVTEVANTAGSSVAVVAVNYRGLTSSQMTTLRSQARQSGVEFKVIRNTLSRRALTGTVFESLIPVLSGPVGLAFSSTEPSSSARLMRDFVKKDKEHEKLEVVGLSLGGELLDSSMLVDVANLPTFEEAISKLLSVMQAPITKLVRTVAAPNVKLVRTLAAISDKKQVDK